MQPGAIKGYLFGAIAAATYGLNPLFALPLYADGMNTDSVLFFRYMLAVIVLGTMLVVRRGHDWKITLRQGLTLGALGVLMAASSLSLFMSYTYMAAGIASTLLFVYPVMTAVIMALCFHEKASAAMILSIVLAMAGIALLYKGDDGSTLSLFGTILVFISALTYALYLIGVNHWGLGKMPTLKVTVYVIAAGFLFFSAKLAISQDLTIPNHWYMWGCVIALAILPTAVSLLCTTAAIQRIGSTPTAILGALEPVTAVIIGALVFHELLTIRLTIGIVLIIAAVTLVILSSRVEHKLLKIRKLFPRIRH